MLIDEVLQDSRRRSSSAWAKNALASFKISLALRSSLTSRSSAFICSRSEVVMPSSTPVSIWSRLTHSDRGLRYRPLARNYCFPSCFENSLGQPLDKVSYRFRIEPLGMQLEVVYQIRQLEGALVSGQRPAVVM